MSEPDAVPLPREGEVFFDVRGEARCLRLSWYADSAVAVFSIWQGRRCTGTFRLPFKDLARMVEILQSGPGKPAVAGRTEHGYLDSRAGHELGYPDRLAAQGYRTGQHGVSQHGVSQHGASQHGASQHGDSVPGYGSAPYALPDYDPPNYSDAAWQANSQPYPADRPQPAYADPAYRSEPGYRADPGYPPEPGYQADAGYHPEPGYHPDQGYHPGPGYHPDPNYPPYASYPRSADRHGSFAPNADLGDDTLGLRSASPVYAGHAPGPWLAAPTAPYTGQAPYAGQDGDDRYAAGANSAADSGRADSGRAATGYAAP